MQQGFHSVETRMHRGASRRHILLSRFIVVWQCKHVQWLEQVVDMDRKQLDILCSYTGVWGHWQPCRAQQEPRTAQYSHARCWPGCCVCAAAR